MRTGRLSPSLIPIGTLVVILGILAVLQYRWTGALSEGEEARMRRGLAESVRLFTGDFDSALDAIFEHFDDETFSLDSDEDRIARQLDAGWSDAHLRLMVRGLWIIRLGIAEDDRTSTSKRYATDTKEWVEQESPARLRDVLIRPPDGRGPRLDVFRGDIPALVIPINRRRDREPPPEMFPRRPAAGPESLLVVELDETFIRQEQLPELISRHFGDSSARSYAIEIVDNASHRVIFQTEEKTGSNRPDMEAPLFTFRGRGTGAPEPPRLGGGPGGRPGGFRGGPSVRPAPSPWSIRVFHLEGSLEEAVWQSRLRNMALGAGVLMLLLAGGVLVIIHADRARALAQQQLDFVAAVTHELNTPIAAISSAGQNLSDGVVTDEAQVRRYGAMLEREGKRLAGVVAQVLDFSGMQHGDPPLSLTTVRVDAVVKAAITDTAWLAEEHVVNVETFNESGDSQIECDLEQMSGALGNLISNAIRYRGSSSEILVGSRTSQTRREVVFSVADKGLGIAQADQKRIFEPFVRGGNVIQGAIRGSGLGLSIVRRIVHAHGGRVTLESSPGKGSTFSICIPTKR